MGLDKVPAIDSCFVNSVRYKGVESYVGSRLVIRLGEELSLTIAGVV